MDIGMRFERLVVVAAAGVSPKGRLLWSCVCDCGVTKVVSGTALRTRTKSCGCARKEGRNTTHGKSKTLAYASWVAMLHRCENPARSRYSEHGGRGIKVCKRWHKFENFYADMGDRVAGLTLERLDNEKGYTPSNCVWADRKQQARNRRNSAWVTVAGETKTVAEWAELKGCTHSTLSWRRQQGWPDIEIVNGRN